MIPFHTIAVPHEDILAGRLTMDIFAADLWEVDKGRAPDEYRDPVRFFQKTYQTEGLTHLLSVVERRLAGKGGDPVIQIQTPFGGGKTHALIAMYHKAPEWNANRVVIVGTPMTARETIWGVLAEQLTGTREGFDTPTAPGREPLRNLLAAHQPLLILMDEVLEYATKAAGVTVGSSTLAAQTLAFLQELTEAVGTLEQTSLVITLPSSTQERYDEGAERLFQQLQRVAGRVEKIYTPVQEHEITQVIRRRLFASVDERPMQEVIGGFLDYAVRESLLPAGVEPSEYRRRFQASYPFLPEVVDILYQRWGSFSTFQRTRGVLRLLALVVHALKDRPIPYISLADFDLGDQEIRRELLKHIGPEYDSVIAADITAEEAGARKVDRELGAAYRGLRLGTRVATSIFLYSFSGGVERGATLGEVKRSATTLSNPASVVAEAMELLRGKLFYLQRQGGKVFFTNQPNLNRILLTKMENVEEVQVETQEKALLEKSIAGRSLKVFLWPEPNAPIPDTPELKLLILRERDELFMEEVLHQKGTTPRVHRNTLFFLAPLEGERPVLERLLRRYLAYGMITEDRTLNLTKEQREEVRRELKKAQEDLQSAIRRTYRHLFIPTREGLREADLGIPTYGERRPLDEEVYEKLRTEGEILERIAPLVIKERYLRNREYVQTEQLVLTGLRTPGEMRVVSRRVWEEGIIAGVEQGLFGLGVLEAGRPVCRYFGETPFVGLAGSEVIIRADLCQAQREAAAPPAYEPSPPPDTASIAESAIREAPVTPEGTAPPGSESGAGARWKRLRLRFVVPKGKVSGLMGVMNLLQHRFDRLEIALTAEDGEMLEQEYEDKVREAFRQLGIEVEEDL
ncbi:MAG: ATP-binding protein [Chloroflexi bacterium]|nr:MAG: ATP-binding protein [Chloroflexota bacterium]